MKLPAASYAGIRKKERGSFLLDVSLFAILYISLMAVVLAGYGVTSSRSDSLESAQQVREIMTRFRGFGIPQNGYTNGQVVPNNAAAIGLGLIPAGYIGPGNSIRSPWGTDINVAATAPQLTIVIEDIPRDECALTASGMEAYATTLSIGGNLLLDRVNGQLLDRAALSQTCAAAAAQDFTVVYQ